MKWSEVKRIVLGVLIVGTLLVSAWSTTATAQGRVVQQPRRVIIVHRPVYFRHYWNPYWYSSPYYYPYYNYYDPIAYQKETGYSDGRSRGKSDAKHGRPSDPNSHKHYNDSDSATYREAFLQGYSEGYRDQTNKLNKG